MFKWFKVFKGSGLEHETWRDDSDRRRGFIENHDSTEPSPTCVCIPVTITFYVSPGCSDLVRVRFSTDPLHLT